MATDRPGHPVAPASPAAGGGAVISLADRMRARQEGAPAATTPAPAATGPARARVAAVTDTCWCCRQKVRAVVGVIVDARHTQDGSGFIPLEAIDETLVARARHPASGPPRHRRTAPPREPRRRRRLHRQRLPGVRRPDRPLPSRGSPHRAPRRGRLVRPARHRHRRRAGPRARRAAHRRHRTRLSAPRAPRAVCDPAHSEAVAAAIGRDGVSNGPYSGRNTPQRRPMSAYAPVSRARNPPICSAIWAFAGPFDRMDTPRCPTGPLAGSGHGLLLFRPFSSWNP